MQLMRHMEFIKSRFHSGNARAWKARIAWADRGEQMLEPGKPG